MAQRKMSRFDVVTSAAGDSTADGAAGVAGESIAARRRRQRKRRRMNLPKHAEKAHVPVVQQFRPDNG